MIHYTLEQAQNIKSPTIKGFCYNGLDCIATYRVRDVLASRMSPAQWRYHNFEMAAQSPAFTMMGNGIPVDTITRGEIVEELRKERTKLIREINATPWVKDLWDGVEKVTGVCSKSTRKDGKHTWEKGVEDTPERKCTSCGKSRFRPLAFNPASPDQCNHLFYDLLRCKPVYNKKHILSTDGDCLERLGRKNPKLRELTEAISTFRDVNKQIGFLTSSLTPDNKWVSSFNVGAAWTGRWSSSSNPLGYGGNAQNITERHRYMFMSNPGMMLVYADLKQAESNIVAHLAGDEKYIQAHIIGDTHTFVCRLVWPEGVGNERWTDDLSRDKKIAQSHRPDWDDKPGHDYRFQSKAVQHGGNLGLTPFGLAMQKHIPVEAARDAQRRYFSAFPHIRGWQNDIAKRVSNQDELINPLGFGVRLFGRPWDDHTVNQGYAVGPQSTVAHLINIAAWRIWRYCQQASLFAQVHDAILFEVPAGRYDLVRKAANLMKIPLRVIDYRGVERITIVDVEAEAGTNWGHAGKDNPHGLKPVELGS